MFIDNLIRRGLAIAMLGLALPFLTFWIPTPALTVLIEIVLVCGFVGGLFLAVIFVVSTLLGNSSGGARR